MKVYNIKFLLVFALFCSQAAYAMTSEFFENVDVHSLKAGVSKYLLIKGAKVYHNESYEANTFQAVDLVRVGTYSTAQYQYAFNLTPMQNGTRLDLIAVKQGSGNDHVMERKLMDNIKQSMQGRFLYGLGFEFDNYSTSKGNIKAPKGKNSGIKLTAVKYDALKKGLQAGDVIIEINGIPISEMPIEDYATVLFAKSINDSVTLTYKRGKETNKVTLTPRVSNRKVF